jgi:hypothetical protein
VVAETAGSETRFDSQTGGAVQETQEGSVSKKPKRRGVQCRWDFTCSLTDRDGLRLDSIEHGLECIKFWAEIDEPDRVELSQSGDEKRWWVYVEAGPIRIIFPDQSKRSAWRRAVRLGKRAGKWVEVYAADGVHFLDPWTGKIFARDTRKDT